MNGFGRIPIEIHETVCLTLKVEAFGQVTA